MMGERYWNQHSEKKEHSLPMLKIGSSETPTATYYNSRRRPSRSGEASVRLPPMMMQNQNIDLRKIKRNRQRNSNSKKSSSKKSVEKSDIKNPTPKLNFGVALQLSKFMSRMRRGSKGSASDHKPILTTSTVQDHHPEDKVFKFKLDKVSDEFSSKLGLKNNKVVHESHSTVMPLNTPEVKQRPLVKTKSSNVLMQASSMTSLREQALQKHASWGLLRNRILHAKISDALTNIKFTLNGKTLRALRCIGEGGYSRVYEVFNEDNEIYALKVVDLNETRVKEELLAEIEFLQDLKHCDKIVDILEHEVKSDVKGIPFLDADVEQNTKQGRKFNHF